MPEIENSYNYSTCINPGVSKSPWNKAYYMQIINNPAQSVNQETVFKVPDKQCLPLKEIT